MSLKLACEYCEFLFYSLWDASIDDENVFICTACLEKVIAEKTFENSVLLSEYTDNGLD